MADNLFGIVSCKCPQCNKSFEKLSAEWVYKIVFSSGTKYYCSYKCWIAASRRKENKVLDRGSLKLPEETVNAIIKLLKEGKAPNQIAEELNVGCGSVYRARERKMKETP